VQEIQKPNYGKNDMTAIEKNWLLWEWGRRTILSVLDSTQSCAAEACGERADVVAET